MRISLALTTALWICLATVARADEPPAPTPPPAHASAPAPMDMQKAMAAAMNGMVPVMGKMSEAMIEAQLQIAARPETAESIATFKRNLYEDLIKKGFHPEQALQLTIATPLPSAGGMGGK